MSPTRRPDRGGDLPRRGGRKGSPPRRHHHGRQRTLGRQARPAARRGASRRRGSGPQDSQGRRQGRRRSPYALCLFLGELASVRGGSQRPQGLARILSGARARRAFAPGCAAQADWRSRRLRSPADGAARAGRRANSEERPADAGRRAELRRRAARLPAAARKLAAKAAAGELDVAEIDEAALRRRVDDQRPSGTGPA